MSRRVAEVNLGRGLESREGTLEAVEESEFLPNLIWMTKTVCHAG